MKFEDHCKESIKIFNKPHKEVHKYLDEFAGSKKYGMKHRRKRHHVKGINEVIEIFGIEAGKVARLHIISDLKEEGWTEKDHLPQNELEYIKMGLF